MATESETVNACTCQLPGDLCAYCQTYILPLVPTQRCITPADTAEADRMAARAREAQRRERTTVSRIVGALMTPAAIAAYRLRRDLARSRA